MLALALAHVIALATGYPPDDDDRAWQLDRWMSPDYQREVRPVVVPRRSDELPLVGADTAAADHACHGFERSGAAWLTLVRRVCHRDACVAIADLVRVGADGRQRRALELARAPVAENADVDLGPGLTRRMLLRANTLLLAASERCGTAAVGELGGSAVLEATPDGWRLTVDGDERGHGRGQPLALFYSVASPRYLIWAHSEAGDQLVSLR